MPYNGSTTITPQRRAYRSGPPLFFLSPFFFYIYTLPSNLKRALYELSPLQPSLFPMSLYNRVRGTITILLLRFDEPLPLTPATLHKLLKNKKKVT